MKPVQSRIGDFRLNAASGLAWEARIRRGKPEAPWTITAPIILAVWFGLVTGLLELCLIYTRSHVLGWSSLSALQINRHFAWMIPIANLALFLGWGLVVGLLGRVWPSFGTGCTSAFVFFCCHFADFGATGERVPRTIA